MVHVEAGRERVGQPEKGAAERCVEPIPDLFLAMADFEIVGAIDEAGCRVEAVLLDVAPMPAALKAVGGVAHRHVGRRVHSVRNCVQLSVQAIFESRTL